jgi:glycosyltransferase involved in cell wall biosynthesis
MRILIVSWYYPPANDVAALRVGTLSKYLHETGHEVWVLTGQRPQDDESLPVPLPADRVLRAPWFDVDDLLFPWKWRLIRTRAKSNTPPSPPGPPRPGRTERSKFLRRLVRLYLDFVRIPDHQAGWQPFASKEGRRLLSSQPFDLIYASGPPFSAFFVARRLSARFGVPWVAEYRDGWARDVYSPRPKWRGALDAFLESRVTRTATAIIAISEPWAAFYRAKFNLPVATVYNGIDPETVLPETAAPPKSSILSIVHVGSLYSGLRNPKVLFEAIKRSQLTPADLKVEFYSAAPDEVLPVAERCGVKEFIALHPRVPHHQSLRIQRDSDVLLLLQSGKDARNLPAKIFEYLAARRPILGLGLDDGIPARLVRERNAGFYVSDADAIAGQLKRWVAEKKENGVIADLPESVKAGLSRADQFRVLAGFLASVQRKAQPKPAEESRPISAT